MKPRAIIIFDLFYYEKKKKYIKDNFEVIAYSSYYEKFHGIYFEGYKVLPIGKIPYISYDKVIIAMPLTPDIKIITEYLIQNGVAHQDIELLYGVKQYSEVENLAHMIKNVRYEVNCDGEILCKIDNMTFMLSNVNEQFIIKEVFGEKCYNFSLAGKKQIVLDIGMNIGIASIYFSNLPSVYHIYAYEPFQQTYQRAIQNFSLNHDQNKITPHPFGLGKSNQVLEVDYFEHAKGLMSTQRNNVETLPSKASQFVKEQVELQDIAKIFPPIKERHPDCDIVLKIDCEGSEYEIMERLEETGLINQVACIIMEWHRINGKYPEMLMELLQRNQFAIHMIGSSILAAGTIFALNMHKDDV